METETLSNYEQDKRILDDAMDVNIPNHDDDSNSLNVNEVDSDVSVDPLSCESIEKKSTETVSSSENKICSSDNLEKIIGNEENEDVISNNINSPNVSSTNHEEEEEGNSSLDESCSTNNERTIIFTSEDENSMESEPKDPLNDDVQSLSDEDEENPLDDEIRKSVEVVNEVEENPLDDESRKSGEVFNEDEENPLGDESRRSAEIVNEDEENPLDDESRRSVEVVNEDEENPLGDESRRSAEVVNEDEENLLDDESRKNVEVVKEDEENPLDDDSRRNVEVINEDEENPLDDESRRSEVINVDEKKNEEPVKDLPDARSGENNTDLIETEKDKTAEVIIDESKENSDSIKDTEKVETNNEGSEEAKKSEKTEECQFSLLKETLSKNRDVVEDKETPSENGMDDMDMDDDFDPSLLCPDIAMEVDEAPVITTTDVASTDGSRSPLLYDPVYSTYVDEMTGAEVTFNLTPEEHQMRQERYGEKNPIQYTRIHCTACNIHLGSALDGQSNRFVHPLLKVLICKNCYHFYTSGEFEKDEDGSELYCRWCGQGGQVMCCSSCEMVFCKKCIRINFGRKKLTEIRDSDDWNCFRCNPTQLKWLRVHCAEFMEYVRREISRAATLEDATSFMTTDYTQCCLAQKKKYVDPNASEPKKRRKKGHDPDYDPEADYVCPVESSSPKLVSLMPKPIETINAAQPNQAGMQGKVFRVGNTTFRPRVTAIPQIRPTGKVQIPTTGVCSSGPGYIKIMPSGIRAASSITGPIVRPQSFQQRPGQSMGNAQTTMKHEWFEKTVRAAARVNSNLSYTLTQLNRAQASASSVEALAVVHNKLQEILSTSINSLIQIRKNLRTEFIAGIKNIRFPPKPPQLQPASTSQDDDVIFVSPTTSPIPPPLPATTLNNISPSVSLICTSNAIKRNFVPIVPTTTLQPIASSSGMSGDRPKSFLRVKSLSALQSVPSECITIPDDPLPTNPPPLTPIKRSEEVTTIEDSPEKKVEDFTQVARSTPVRASKSIEKIKISENKSNDNKPSNLKENADKVEEIADSSEVEKNCAIFFDARDCPSPELRKMANTKVYLTRSKSIDDLVRNTFQFMNGETLD